MSKTAQEERDMEEIYNGFVDACDEEDWAKAQTFVTHMNDYSLLNGTMMQNELEARMKD